MDQTERVKSGYPPLFSMFQAHELDGHWAAKSLAGINSLKVTAKGFPMAPCFINSLALT